jgi:hypothetical protein
MALIVADLSIELARAGSGLPAREQAGTGAARRPQPGGGTRAGKMETPGQAETYGVVGSC